MEIALGQLCQSRSWLNTIVTGPTFGRSSGGSIIKSSKFKLISKKPTKKHYRKHYNTKKKQVRRFVKKTKINKRRNSKQSRRVN